jgi:hypothetical protein
MPAQRKAMTSTDQDETPSEVLDPDQPRLAELSQTFKRCSPSGGAFNRLFDAERIRFALWPNQSRDCRKASAGDFKAQPWEGASDQRVLLADDIIADDVDILVNAFWRSLTKAEGTQVRDAAAAAVASRMIYWMVRTRLNETLQREVELAAQYQRTYGWVVVQTGWDRRFGKRKVTLTLNEVASIAPDIAVFVQNPDMDEQSAQLVRRLYAQRVQQELESLELERMPELSLAQAKKLVKELREDGDVEFEVPALMRNQPSIRALQPWRDVFIPDEQGDTSSGQVFVRERLSEDDLRAREFTEGWDPEWIAAAWADRGKYSSWTDEADKGRARVHETDYVADTEDGVNLVEVVTAYTTRIDQWGVPGVYVTVFSPHFDRKPESDKELCARHGLCDFKHGKMPFASSAAEWWCRSLTASRGVPERAFPQQRSIKVQQDALIDRTSLTTLPPRLVPSRMMDEQDVFGPAARIPTLRGEEPRFMELPGHDGVAESIIRLELEIADQRFGRMTPNAAPARVQMKQQRMVSNFLSLWNEVFQQMWALMQQYLTPGEWEGVTGTPKPPMTGASIAGETGIILQTDVRDQDMEFSIKKLQAISQFVVPEDAAGVIDKTQLVRMKLMAVDPLLAQSLLVSDASASAKLQEQVNADIAAMFLGNPPRLVENDPTAPAQLGFAQQIIGANPFYQKELVGNPEGRFAQAMQNWAQNRQQSAVQQQNKVVGRLGVQPMEGNA